MIELITQIVIVGTAVFMIILLMASVLAEPSEKRKWEIIHKKMKKEALDSERRKVVT